MRLAMLGYSSSGLGTETAPGQGILHKSGWVISMYGDYSAAIASHDPALWCPHRSWWLHSFSANDPRVTLAEGQQTMGDSIPITLPSPESRPTARKRIG